MQCLQSSFMVHVLLTLHSHPWSLGPSYDASLSFSGTFKPATQQPLLQPYRCRHCYFVLTMPSTSIQDHRAHEGCHMSYQYQGIRLFRASCVEARSFRGQMTTGPGLPHIGQPTHPCASAKKISEQSQRMLIFSAFVGSNLILKKRFCS